MDQEMRLYGLGHCSRLSSCFGNTFGRELRGRGIGSRPVQGHLHHHPLALGGVHAFEETVAQVEHAGGLVDETQREAVTGEGDGFE